MAGKFYVGAHQPSDVIKIDRPVCVSINRLRDRVNFGCPRGFILDSGGFTAVTNHACHIIDVDEYSMHVRRFSKCVGFIWAASQDFMCEYAALKKTGLSVDDHQTLSTDRYLQLMRTCEVVPTVQGSTLEQYEKHAIEISKIDRHPQTVAVGSVCRLNSVERINEIVGAVRNVFWKSELHGFGVKIDSDFDSSDSMAWSIHERKNGRNGNCWLAAQKYHDKVSGSFCDE